MKCFLNNGLMFVYKKGKFTIKGMDNNGQPVDLLTLTLSDLYTQYLTEDIYESIAPEDHDIADLLITNKVIDAMLYDLMAMLEMYTPEGFYEFFRESVIDSIKVA